MDINQFCGKAGEHGLPEGRPKPWKYEVLTEDVITLRQSPHKFLYLYSPRSFVRHGLEAIRVE